MRRYLWMAAGLLALGTGVVGIALPVLPTVPFLILAAFCFSRSHPEWAERIHAHPRYGHHLVAWRDRRAISRKGKVAALLAMTASVPFTAFVAGWPWWLVPAGVLVTIGPWIWTRAE